VENELRKILSPVAGRLKRRIVLRHVAAGLIAGGAAGIVLALAWSVSGVTALRWAAIAAVVVIPVLSIVRGIMTRVAPAEAARAIDARYRLKDRTATALAFTAAGADTEARRMQVEDAVQHLKRVVPSEVVRTAVPKNLLLGFGLVAVAVCLMPVSLRSLLTPEDTDPDAEIRAAVEAGELTEPAPLPKISPQLAGDSIRARAQGDVETDVAGAGPATLGYRGMVGEFFEQSGE